AVGVVLATSSASATASVITTSTPMAAIRSRSCRALTVQVFTSSPAACAASDVELDAVGACPDRRQEGPDRVLGGARGVAAVREDPHRWLPTPASSVPAACSTRWPQSPLDTASADLYHDSADLPAKGGSPRGGRGRV